MDLFDLTGKTAVITGSSRGIGRAIAEQMAAAGAKVVISSRKAGPCEEVAAAINQAGGKAVSIPCHVGEKAQLQALIERTRAELGPVDILVCNAAVNPYYGPLLDVPDEAYDKTMNSNVRSNLWLMQLVLPEMAKRKDGVVIIISSIAGLRGSPMLGAYAISKAADLQLCRNLAVEWGQHNIRINCIVPGLVKTDFARALWEDPVVLEQAVSNAPLRRIGEPIEIAGAAVFLASKAGTFVTGQAIVVDGGVTIAGRV
ncbi:MAG TPA: glucose 1-dehydrogenase [Stellaceae bacterium]|jgi:NAD(P)-dependent dehydrogenase (short-subunit alcohol dehydrogenase family)|nr:glucose 1-dehydrogenase [Stellaceae bacterium]